MTDTETIRNPPSRPQFLPQQIQNPTLNRPNQPIGQPTGNNIRPLLTGTNQPPRSAPAPLRRVDSKGNVLMNPSGQPLQPRPPGPQMNPTNRPPLPPGAGQNPGMQARPQNPQQFPGNASQNMQQPQGMRPQLQLNNNNQPPNQQMRPPFPRVPGQHPVTAPNQPPFRPPFPQQQQQQPQLQQQPQQQQQPIRPTPAPITKTDSNASLNIDPLKTQIQTNNNPTVNNNSNYHNEESETHVTKVITNNNVTLSKQNSSDEPQRTRQQQDNVGESLSNIMEHSSIYGQNKPQSAQQASKQHVEDRKSQLQQQNEDRKHGEDRKQQHQTKPMGNESVRSSAIQQKTYTELKKDSKNRSIKKGDNDSGVDESTQGNERNGPGSPGSPLKSPTKPSGISRPPSATPSNKSSKSRSASRSRLLAKTPEPEPVKKVPMNKIKVGYAPSPDLKAVRSKIGSLDNSSYRPGGGHVKIENKRVDIKAAPRIEAKNDKYIPKGGDKKIITTKLQWNAKSKIGSLENTTHKPGGGDKRIESLKTDFKDKAKSKVGSKDNVKYVPGGGDIKEKSKENNSSDIQTQKVEIKAQSKIGSLDNVKHKPGGGDKKIFDDKDYLKNVEHSVALTQPQSPESPAVMTSSSGADENLNKQQS